MFLSPLLEQRLWSRCVSATLFAALLLGGAQTLFAEAGELYRFQLSSQGPKQLNVLLDSDKPIDVEREKTPTGQILHLKDTHLADSLKKQGAPIVVDNANRFIGRVVPDGPEGVRIILPNIPKKVSVNVMQHQGKPSTAEKTWKAQTPSYSDTMMPKLGQDASTKQALKSHFNQAAKAALAGANVSEKVKESASAASSKPSSYMALPAVGETHTLERPVSRPQHAPPARYQVSTLSSKNRVTHVNLPKPPKGQKALKTSGKKAANNTTQWKALPSLGAEKAQSALPLPKVVPLFGAGYEPQAPTALMPGYAGTNWQAVAQQAPLGRVTRSTQQQKRSWFEGALPNNAIAISSPASEGSPDTSDTSGTSDGMDMPYGLVAQPEQEMTSGSAVGGGAGLGTGFLAFMDQITGDTFSKPYGVAFWGIVISLGCLGCLGFLALAIGALCARFIMSPPSMNTPPQPIVMHTSSTSEDGETVVLTPMAQKYLSPEQQEKRKKERDVKGKTSSQSHNAGDYGAQGTLKGWQNGRPADVPTSMYHTSPIGKQVEASQKRHLLRRRLKNPAPPLNVASAIEDALRQKL